MHIVLDAMGSDDHPGPELAAATEAHRLWGDRLTLTGPAEELESRIDASLADIVDASQVLGMTDKPALDAKNKPNSSMAVGMRPLEARWRGCFRNDGQYWRRHGNRPVPAGPHSRRQATRVESGLSGSGGIYSRDRHWSQY